MGNEKPAKQPNPHAAVMAGVQLSRDRSKARAEIEKIKADLDAATKRVEDFSSDEKRKSIREQDRRSLLAGRVFLDLVADDPTYAELWADFWPHLADALKLASDTDRALYDLPPHPKKPDAKQDSEAAEVLRDNAEASQGAAPKVTDEADKAVVE